MPQLQATPAAGRLHLEVDLDEMTRIGALSPSLAAYLRAAVNADKNVLVTGTFGVGKTTTLRAMLNELPPKTRIGTVETEDELQIHALKDRHFRVWAGQQSLGGVIADMVPMALGANATVIAIGECRGDDDAFSLLDAMQTGSQCLATVYGTSSRDALSRLVTMATRRGSDLAWASHALAANIDVIVHLARLDERHLGGGQYRYVTEVTLPEPSPDGFTLHALYRRGPDGRAVPEPANTPTWIDDLTRQDFDQTWLTPERGGWEQPMDRIKLGPQ